MPTAGVYFDVIGTLRDNWSSQQKHYNMSKHGTIRRYTLEIEKICRGQFPSFNVIKDYLFEHGFEVSTIIVSLATILKKPLMKGIIK